MTYITKQSYLDKVEQILTERPAARDNTTMLVLSYWIRELVRLGVNPKTTSLYDGFIFLSQEPGLPPVETITRNSRIVQSRNPQVRGKLYLERQEREKEVRKEMRDLK